MRLSFRRHELPLRHVFTIARGSTSAYRLLLVQLEHQGVCGYGEAGESDYYGATLDNMQEALEQVREEVEAGRWGSPEDLWERLRPPLAASPFAQCALDVAVHDLWGKLRGEPLWKLWGLSLDRVPASDYTIGIDRLEVMVGKLREFPGWPVYKIKLGTADDLEVVRELRRHTDAVFRVDANCGWTFEQAVTNSRALANLGVELIEQPLPPDREEDLRRLYVESPLPIIADESCQVEGDVDRCQGLFHGVNVKLVKCGGLTPGRRMLLRARQLGLKTMIGCMTESTVGISAAAQLLPLCDYADLDGAVLLAEDIATGAALDRGRILLPDAAGCGTQLPGSRL